MLATQVKLQIVVVRRACNTGLLQLPKSRLLQSSSKALRGAGGPVIVVQGLWFGFRSALGSGLLQGIASRRVDPSCYPSKPITD